MKAQQTYGTPGCLEEDEMWIKQQKYMDIIEYEEIERRNKEENEKWLKADRIAVAKWNELQKKLELDRLKHLEEEIRIQKVFSITRIHRIVLLYYHNIIKYFPNYIKYIKFMGFVCSMALKLSKKKVFLNHNTTSRKSISVYLRTANTNLIDLITD